MVALLGGMALLEAPGSGFKVSNAQSRHSVTFCCLLMELSDFELLLQHRVCLGAAMLLTGASNWGLSYSFRGLVYYRGREQKGVALEK